MGESTGLRKKHCKNTSAKMKSTTSRPRPLRKCGERQEQQQAPTHPPMKPTKKQADVLKLRFKTPTMHTQIDRESFSVLKRAQNQIRQATPDGSQVLDGSSTSKTMMWSQATIHNVFKAAHRVQKVAHGRLWFWIRLGSSIPQKLAVAGWAGSADQVGRRNSMDSIASGLKKVHQVEYMKFRSGTASGWLTTDFDCERRPQLRMGVTAVKTRTKPALSGRLRIRYERYR